MSQESILTDILKQRHSIRKFQQRPIPRDILLEVMDAVRSAPSASNRQPWRFYVVDDEKTKSKLAEAGAVMQKFVFEAPLFLVCCADMSVYTTAETTKVVNTLVSAGAMDGNDLTSYWSWWESVSDAQNIVNLAYLDIGIGVQQVVLMAAANGLGSCWMRRIDPGLIANILELPPNMAVISLLVLGYPDETPAARPRKPLQDLLLKI